MATNEKTAEQLIAEKQRELYALCTGKFTPPYLDEAQRRGLDAGMLTLITEVRELQAAP